MTNSLRVSIITVSYNSEKTIESTIKSVRDQDWANIEYIIIDGGSTDGTSSAVQKYSGCISKYVSEKDEGIYDAMNKGIKIATGDVIGILNSDDTYFGPDVVSKAVRKMTEARANLLYGDLVFVERNSTDIVKRRWQSGSVPSRGFKYGWHPPHPTVFVQKSIYANFGVFDLDFRISADYDLMLRFIEIHKVSTVYLPEEMVRMSLGGASTSGLRGFYSQTKEDLMVLKKNRYGNVFTVILKKLRKLIQLLR
jgi:glycosyltransferase